MTDEWKLVGLCRDEAFLKDIHLTSDAWFQDVRRVVTAKVKEVCKVCPVMELCRAEAREDGIPFGVWGGEDERERERYWQQNGGQPRHFVDSLLLDVRVAAA